MTKNSWETKSREAAEEDLARLEKWLTKQPHLPPNVDKGLLSSFVESTPSLEIGKQKLDRFLSERSRLTKYFSPQVRDASHPQFLDAAKAVQMFILPSLTPEGYMVLFAKTTPHFEECFDHLQTAIRFFMLLELAMVRWPSCAGIYCAGDIGCITANVATKLSPTILLTCTPMFQTCYPMELRSAFGINSPHFIALIYNTVVKPFLGEIGNMVCLSADDASFLKEYIPVEMMPSDYGGREKSSSELHEYWMREMAEKREWFVANSQLSVDEAKRPADGTSSFGVDGTFRSLTID